VIEVTAFGAGRPRDGLRVHRTTTLDPLTDVVRQPDGLPLTSAIRTLADLAGTLDVTRLRRAVRRAELHRLLDVSKLPLTGKGAHRLREAVGLVDEPQITRSELEERFLDLVAEAGLPQPAVNATVEGYEVDFVWRRERLIVETDGRAAHLTPTAFEDDRQRDVELRIAGWTMVRFTWRQVVHEPATVVANLRALFRAAALGAASPATRSAA
jgi:REase_MTES_1575